MMKNLLLSSGIMLALSTTVALAQTQPVSIKFAGEFAGKPFSCGSDIEGIGTKKTTITPRDYRLYVSEFELVKADGTAVPLTLDQDGKWQHKSVALLDFENAAGGCSNGTPDVHDVVTGTVPAGTYKGLRFKVGVPFDLNHNDPTLAPSPLSATSMFWTWQGGYKFIKIDFAAKGTPMVAEKAGAHQAPAAGANGAGFSLHLGSTMCQASSRTSAPSTCANSNRIDVAFDAFDPAKNVIVFDPAPVLATTDVTFNTPETSPGCMSFPNDPECTTVMPKLGLAYGAAKAEPQAFVRSR